MIHKGFDFSQLGGMPFNQQRLEWMQTAYAELSDGLAAMFGDNVIVSGCYVSGNNVSDGWIVVNGELLPFIGTQTGVLDTFLIRKTTTPLIFKDGTSKNVQFSKVASFGTSSDAIRWDSLQRLPSFKAVGDHLKAVNNPHKVTKAQVGLGNLPNAISSDGTSNSEQIIASTAMVHNAILQISEFSASFDFSTSTESILVPLSKEILDVKSYITIVRLWEIRGMTSSIQTYVPADSLIVETYLDTRQHPHESTESRTHIFIKVNHPAMNKSSKYQAQFLLLKVKKVS